MRRSRRIKNSAPHIGALPPNIPAQARAQMHTRTSRFTRLRSSRSALLPASAMTTLGSPRRCSSFTQDLAPLNESCASAQAGRDARERSGAGGQGNRAANRVGDVIHDDGGRGAPVVHGREAAVSLWSGRQIAATRARGRVRRVGEARVAEMDEPCPAVSQISNLTVTSGRFTVWVRKAAGRGTPSAGGS